MRGKACCLQVLGQPVGITPAYAGKRAERYGCNPRSRDHPRLCGEKTPALQTRCLTIGSPPPMRGKGPVDVFRVRNVGITPAYAGKRESPSTLDTM